MKRLVCSLFLILGLFLTAACSNSATPTTTTVATGLTCTATETTTNTLSVYFYDGTGPYTVSGTGITSQTTSANPFTTTTTTGTLASGTAISVTDTATGATTSCLVNSGTTGIGAYSQNCTLTYFTQPGSYGENDYYFVITPTPNAYIEITQATFYQPTSAMGTWTIPASSFPITASNTTPPISFPYAGSITGTFTAQSYPGGVPCNGGLPLTTIFYAQ